AASRQWTPVGDLSGGERRRLQLLRLLMAEPNVLLLDEPTNDLDIDTLTALEDLLDDVSLPATLLLLDGITDPRNLGACLRVADGAGVAAVIAPKDHACLLTDVAVQTASGAAESVPYIMVTNLARTIDAIQERDFRVIGTADEAEQSLYEEALSGSVAWVLGAEGRGLRRLVRERCDTLVRIPMSGEVASLNVSVAAGVVLYETLRQRHALSASAS
ncbi:MAG: 23S rRNA (guanosine(2251)-2'-O)-methyltransferase RlmB, partial [Gammaproteobacteria bacterium]